MKLLNFWDALRPEANWYRLLKVEQKLHIYFYNCPWNFPFSSILWKLPNFTFRHRTLNSEPAICMRSHLCFWLQNLWLETHWNPFLERKTPYLKFTPRKEFCSKIPNWSNPYFANWTILESISRKKISSNIMALKNYLEQKYMQCLI